MSVAWVSRLLRGHLELKLNLGTRLAREVGVSLERLNQDLQTARERAKVREETREKGIERGRRKSNGRVPLLVTVETGREKERKERKESEVAE
jgi:hypothetical protein